MCPLHEFIQNYLHNIASLKIFGFNKQITVIINIMMRLLIDLEVIAILNQFPGATISNKPTSKSTMVNNEPTFIYYMPETRN